jgi:PAS domain S-box-containing protein
MKDIHLLKRRIEPMYSRLSELYRNADSCSSPSSDLLPTALKELGVISEVLQVAMDELITQNEQLIDAQSQIIAERRRYQELFEFALDGYLVTDLEGIICEANRAAADLFSAKQQSLMGKPLISLIDPKDYACFQTKISQLRSLGHVELVVRSQPQNTNLIEIALTASMIFDPNGNCLGLRWLLRDVTEQKRAEAALFSTEYTPCQDRVLYSYRKGEVIPLEPQAVWIVAQGVVKLTTLSEGGTEMLVGLATESMVFGSSLTALQVYQAIALSEVQLALIPLTEITQSPRLVQALLPMINQRLRQAESFLSIYGEMHVEDRLNRLLSLLQQVIGHPTGNGIRLRIRLTHQDFASACCTTRVTITRLLSKLQQKGKIILDSKSHITICK